MTLVTRAHEIELERFPEPLVEKPEAQRFLFSTPCALLGSLFGRLLEFLPAEWVLRQHDRFFRLAAERRVYPFDPAAAVLERARGLVQEVEREAGRPAALLGLSVHAPDMEEHRHLTFELVRRAILALRRLRGGPCRPRIVGAVDAFALDSFSIVAESAYAGFMSQYHLGLDRLSRGGRGPISRRLLRSSSWDRMPWRMLRVLGSGGEVEIALAGGVPGTARVLYTVREWLIRQRRRSPQRARPEEIRRRLGGSPGFARFQGDCPDVDIRTSAWRLLESWAMAALTGQSPRGESAARLGRLTPAARAVLEECLEILGLTPAETAASMAELAEELPRRTPYRARLFRLLAGRVLRRGRPLVLLPVVFRSGGGLRLELRGVWALDSAGDGRLRARIASEPPETWFGDADGIAVRFGKENFS